jgi:predicted RNase H-like HicB family nuclease
MRSRRLRCNSAQSFNNSLFGHRGQLFVMRDRFSFSSAIVLYTGQMQITLTAVYRKFPEGYAAFVEELPGANTQGRTLEEARANLSEAISMVLQANRELAGEANVEPCG